MNTVNKVVNYFQGNRIVQHVLFWIAVLFLNVPREAVLRDDPFYVILVMHTCILISQIITSYYLAYYVIPKFFLKKKYVLTIVLILVGTYFLSALNRTLVIHVGETLVRKPPFIQEPILEILTDWKKLLCDYVPSIYSVAVIFLFVKFFVNYKRIKEKDLAFRKEKVEAELKTLRAQLNPHFLFNTLNNIYTLSLDNSPQTPTSIGKLSEILDHVLYRCNGKFVTLSSEIELLKNYIELEKLRYDDRLQVSFISNIEEDIEIPPLVLLSLVENAFKHGVGEDSGSPTIGIEVSYKNEVFIFSITNTVSKDYESKNKENIGIRNIRKQLDLIYVDAYKLKIKNSETRFTVILEINQKIML